MTSEQMSEAIAAAKVGDYVLVQHTGSDRAVRYRVARTYGGRARQLELVGVRGAKRVLVDGGAQIWLRESVAGQRRATKDEAHRRVTSVRACDAHGQRLDTAEVWQDVGQKLDFYVDSPTPVVDIARAQLPEGYEVGTVGAGYVAILEGDQPEEVGPERANPWEAVVDAWRDIGELQSALINARGRESQFVDNARACEETALRDRGEALRERDEAMNERDEALRDAYRCRQALQQILEIVRAVPPSGRALALDGSPEAVAAAVGHVLRCEAKR
jgi:hypothetical protein